MALLVLRSLAVYGLTAAAFLLIARRHVCAVSLRAGLLLAAAPLLFTGKAMLTGGVYAPLDIAFDGSPLLAHRAELGIGPTRNPLAVDVVSQMIPWRQAVREAVENGRFPLWNRFVLAGEPLLGVAQPAVFHPGTWLGFLLPLPQAWTFDMSLRIFLSALCAYLFFHGTGASEPAALLGAIGWAYSDFLMFFLGYPVAPSVGPFPLLLLALKRLSEGGGRSAAALLAGTLVLIVVAGHPETLLFCVAGAGIAFLFYLARATPGQRRRPVLLSLAAGGLAFALSAVALFPFLEALPQTQQHMVRKLFFAGSDRSDSVLDSLRRLMSDVIPYFYGRIGGGAVARFSVPVGYAGSLLFPLALAGLGTRGRERWLWVTFGVLGLSLSSRLVGVSDLFAALPLFDIAVLDYFVFLAIFALAALAVAGLDRLRAGRGAGAFAAASVASVCAIVLLTSSRQVRLAEFGMSPSVLRQRVLMQVVPLLLGLAIVGVASRRSPGAASRWIAVLLLLFAAQRGFEESGVYPTFRQAAFYPRLPFLDRAARDRPSRVAGSKWTLVPNASALYDLEDVRGYEAMVFAPLAETFGLWSVPLPVFFNEITKPSPFLSFLNVRYLIVGPPQPGPPDWPLVARERGTRLYENPNALARAFVPRHVAWTDNPTLQLWILRKIGDYANDGVAGESLPGNLRWRTNGAAEVRIASYAADRMRLSIDARDETLVGTSIPSWRGWRLRIDGRRAPLIPFNHAFLSFRVPAGRHEAVLRYLPDGFVYGAAITGAAVVLCAVLALRSRRPRTEPPAPAASPPERRPEPPTTRSTWKDPPRGGGT